MKTITVYKSLGYTNEVPEFIDSLYEKYGKRVINISITKTEKFIYIFYTILKDEEHINNID